MATFPYGEKEMSYLSKRDFRLGAYIERVGYIEREVNTDIFAGLVDTILSQQISGSAALAILQKLIARAGTITPQTIVELGSDALREIGASTRKAENIVYIAQAIFDHALDLDALRDMRDEDVVAKLVELPGIGRWTAEMVLIFSLLRKNIVSYTDFGIKKGMMLLYEKKDLHRRDFDKIILPYAPYGSIASFYLWNAAGEKEVLN